MHCTHYINFMVTMSKVGVISITVLATNGYSKAQGG